MQEYLGSFQKLEFDKVKKYIQRHSISDLGRERLEQLSPSANLSEIQHHLALVSEMKLLFERDEVLPLDNVSDIRTSLHRASIEDYILTIEELHRITLVLSTSRALHAYFTRRLETYPKLRDLALRIQVQKVLEFNIRGAIDEDGNLKDSASKELTGIRREIAAKNLSLKKSLQSILKSIIGKEWTQEDIITTRDGRMVIPIKAEHKNRIPGFIHSASGSGATVFIEPTETLELNNEIRTLEFQEKREIEKILKALTAQVRDVCDEIRTSLAILGELDFIQSKAKYSIEVLASEPKIVEAGTHRLSNAFHPILLHRHGQKDVVPLDIEIPADVRTIVITGPNAGGKSVAMKTLGLLSILAQSGCHIPASPNSELKVFEQMFVDMGDEQSIENDLSSFSSHLSNLREVIDHSTNRSLVLIDEIGSGTDPNEGASLAAAILEKLTETGSLNVVTTHHGSLKTFAFDHPHIQNAAMEFDEVTLRPTYRFRAGLPGSSYAIEMAERMKLPREIIDRSRELRGTEANKLENLIGNLEKESQEVRSQIREVESEQHRLNTLIQDYQTKITTLQKERSYLKIQAVNEARELLQKANLVVEESIREIREKAAEKGIVKKTRQIIQDLDHEYRSLQRTLEEKDRIQQEYNVGDKVQLEATSSIGEVTSKLDSDHYIILVGGMRVNVSSADLRPSSEKNTIAISSNQEMIPSSDISREVDLRGMFGHEAIDALDKFLDSAVLAGLHRVDIIHGKGTGALRKKISDFLSSHRAIKSFRLGEWNEGGSGVTVVELE